ncbi:MAG: AI-2E family transporter [Halorientalis sp.]
MRVPWNLTPGKAAWWLVGVLLTLLVAVAIYSFLGAIVVGVFLYYAIRPVDRWFGRHSNHRTLNATLTLLLVGVPILAILGYGALVAVTELDQLLARTGTQRFRTLLQPYLDIARLTDPSHAMRILESNAGRILGYTNVVFTWLLRVFVIVVVAYYLLRDDDRLAAWFRSTFEDTAGLVPFMTDVDDDLTTIYTGNLITVAISALIAVLVYLALDFVAPPSTGVPFPVLLGLLTGIFTIVPVVGMKLIYLPYTAYLLVEAVRNSAVPLWYPIVFFLVVLIVVDSVPDFFIRSLVSKGDLHMGLVLFAYVLGTIAFGWYGLFLGPIILVLFVHFSRTVLPILVSDRPLRVERE